MTIWANLLLQLNPGTLDASQRIRLVSTVADYLHLPLGFVHLYSTRKSFIQEKLRVCRQGGFVEKTTSGHEKQDASAGVIQLLWRVGCQGEEQRSDLARVLEHSVMAGGLATLLEAPVLGWRVLCASEVRHNVKRDLQRLKFTTSQNAIVPPPTQIHRTVKLEHSDIYSLPLTKLEPSLSTVLLHVNHVGTGLEPTHAEYSSEKSTISVREEFLPQPSGAQDNTCTDSTKKVFKFTTQGSALTVIMHHPDIDPEIPIAILKTNRMEEMQMFSNSLLSTEQITLYPYSHESTLLEVSTGEIILATLHTSVSAEFGCSHPNWPSVHSSQEYIKTAGLSASEIKPHGEATSCSDLFTCSEATSDTSLSISEYFQTTELFHLPLFPESTSTVRTFLGERSADTALSLFPSSTLHSIYPPLQLTPDSYSAPSTLTHEAFDRNSLATRLTLRPHPKETPLWAGAYRASRTDSESQPTVSSLGDICNQGPINDLHSAKPTLHNLPSVSHLPLTESYNDVLLLNSRLKTKQSLQPSNKIPSTQPFPDVSPTSRLMTEHLSITQHFDTIQHLSSVLNQDVMSRLNATIKDVSPTALTGEMAVSGQTELESSLSMSLLAPLVTTFTPALPSELNIIHPGFTESLKASADTSFFSQQKDLESPVVTELCFDQTSSDIILMSLQPTSWALQISLPLTKTHHIIYVPLSMFRDQPSIKSAHESLQFMPSMLLGESQHTFPHISSVIKMTTSTYLNPAVLTTIAPSPHVTHPAPLSMFESTRPVSEDHFDPTAPSAVQEPYITSFTYQIQNLDPSFPAYGQSVAQDHVNGCTPEIRSTYLKSTVEHILDVLTSYSQDKKHWTAFQSQFVMFDSSGQLFSTQTSSPTMHLSDSATTEINHITATPQMDISVTLPTLDGSFSAITYTSLAESTSALSGNCVSTENSLLTHQTDSSGPVSKGLPTQQILSTSLSPFYGLVTTLLTSIQAVGLSSYRTQSSVQPTPPSASISSSVNLPPKVLQSIPALTATVGFPFHYSIPPKTFLDPEDGEADALSLEIRLIDGPPVGVGTWLALDGLELHGVPLEVDLQFAPQHLLLAARDGQGLSTWLPLTLYLHRSPVDPCHTFTLTAQRSLHSILRHRHRVEMLLRKLSRFFNSSSAHHLSVVSMRPGSTVVSWYNYSLCRMGRNRVSRCHVGQIQSMWLAMRSADGSVNPTFREAMLPEFPITKVGPVSYRQDCFSTTTAPLFDGSTPTAHTSLTPGLGTNTSLSPTFNTCVSASPAITAASQQIHYQWMAAMFTALLVVCTLILIVLLVAAVFYFCKRRRRSRTVAIWPASRVLSVQSTDLRAIRPRRPPLFQSELPPPPLRLWINLSQGDEGRLPSTWVKQWIHGNIIWRPCRFHEHPSWKIGNV
uniref:Peptidase S72 domain-containing protein n=1 Tax=Dicentrarchus labrax TaxID=13489 RepID=A0A8P4KJE8_DICLA